jgi:hypothetical protein
MSVTTEKLQIRRQELIGCNHAAKFALSLESQDLSKRLEAVSTRGYSSDVNDPGVKYYEFSGFVRRGLRVAYEHELGGHADSLLRTAEPGIKFISTLLSIVPGRYQEYCQALGSEPRLKGELNPALKRSDLTLRKFIDLPDTSSTRIEEWLGFRNGDSYNTRRAEDFRFEDHAGELFFVVDDETFTAKTAPLTYEPELPEHWQRCPARRLILERIWPAMIDLATETPEFFARDLGLVDN